MSSGAFDGIRVADFAWVGVGPIVSKYLADHGAEVIKIETGTYPEALRRAPPFVDDEPGVDRSGYFANFNSSKLSASLNLKHPRGPELARRLVAECDVVTESFTPGTMERFGISYEDLRKFRPDVVMISMPMFGSTGPWSGYSGYGHVLQGAAGFSHLTGFNGEPPIGTGVAYTDFLVPHFATVSLIAAMDYRRRAGVGQHIDLGQMDAAIHGLGTAVLDWTVNGNEQIRDGNRDLNAAPHGCYQARDGKWVVIGCETEDQWAAMKAAMGRPDWVDLERMRRRHQRLEEQYEMDRHLAAWVEVNTRRPQDPEFVQNENPEQPTERRYTSFELVELMQGFGVPCGVVQSAEDLRNDPQLEHRKHYWMLEHPVMGERSYDGPSFRLSETPGNLSKAAPCLGADNEHVYREVMGMDEDEFVDLLADGAFD